MKKLFTLSTLLLLSIMTFAQTEVDGIYYTFSGTKATVVSGANKYTGSITIPASVIYGGDTYSVTSIGSYAFSGCSGLTSISIPNSVTSIGINAFDSCSGLTSITIPNSVMSIGYGAFYGCSGLTSVIIPNSVTKIGGFAFSGCPGLTSIKVQDGNTKYDSRDNCNAIIETASNTLVTGCKNTVIPNNVTSIGNYAFNGCSKLTSVTIPNSVTSIGDTAFYYCSGLTSVTIGSGVTSIGGFAFSGCSGLTSITIPNSVTSIEQGAFSDCSGLTSVYSYIDEPTSIIYLVNDYTNVTLYVPYGTKTKYQTTNGWKNFANIVEMDAPSAINGVNAEDAKSFVGKIIKDNKIIIMKHGKKHSVSGQGM